MVSRKNFIRISNVLGCTNDLKKLAEIFLRMTKGHITPEEKDQLEEAGILEDISHMPSRVKCAVLGWHTMEEVLKKCNTNS